MVRIEKGVYYHPKSFLSPVEFTIKSTQKRLWILSINGEEIEGKSKKELVSKAWKYVQQIKEGK